MTIGQIAAILGAADGGFRLVNSVIAAFFGSAVGTWVGFLFLQSRKPPTYKPEKLRHRLGADIGEFADVPPQELNHLMVTAAECVFKASNYVWRFSAFMFFWMAGFGVFFEYTKSIGWPYYARLGTPLIPLLLLALICRPFAASSYRRALMRELRRLRAAPAVTA